MRYKTVRSLASFLCLIRFWVNVPPALPGVQEKMWRQGVLASQSRLFTSNAILFALSRKSFQIWCWCLQIKFCNLGRSSYCVEVKPRPWKIPPPLEVNYHNFLPVFSFYAVLLVFVCSGIEICSVARAWSCFPRRKMPRSWGRFSMISIYIWIQQEYLSLYTTVFVVLWCFNSFQVDAPLQDCSNFW